MSFEASDEFYVFLFSNEENEYENTSDSFCVKLTTPIQLPHRYRCGVASVTLPTQWCNVTADNGWMEARLRLPRTETRTIESMSKYHEFNVPPVPDTYGHWLSLQFADPDDDTRMLTFQRLHSGDYAKWFNEHVPAKWAQTVKWKIGNESRLSSSWNPEKNIMHELAVSPRKSLVALYQDDRLLMEKETRIIFSTPSHIPANQTLRVRFSLYSAREESVTKYDFSRFRRFHVPPARYDDVTKFLKAVNDANPDHAHFRYEFSENASDKRVHLKVDGHCQMRMSGSLARLLGGFRDDERWIDPSLDGTSVTFQSQRPVNLSQDGVSAFMLYSDVVRYSYIGNIRGPLLYMICPERREGGATDVSGYTPPVIHFHDLASNNFSDIKIYIRTQSGERVQFIGGLTIVKLFFRKV